MLFNNANPNLVGYTRDLVRDPTNAPRETFPLQQVKDFINTSYLALRDRARVVGMGPTLKISYADPVDGQIEYPKPVDFIRLRSCELELGGLDLSTTAPASSNVRILTPEDYVEAIDGYQLGIVTEAEFVAVRDNQIAIIAPPEPAAVGTNALKFVYEASTTLLSADNSEPLLPRPFHDLICLNAASLLLSTVDQTNVAIVRMAALRQQQFEYAITDELWDPDGQVVVAGLDDQTDWHQNMGFMDWK